jgi:phosphohistidine phosphatase
MDLILWRHAQAHLLRDGEADLDRKLTPKGERQAQRMAAWLNQRLADSTRILVSPAQRCQQTATALGRNFKTLALLDPQASVDDLLQASRWPLATEPVLVVGHQPTLGMVAAQLIAGLPQPWAIKKGSVWWLRQREKEEEGGPQLVLQAVQSPDCL